MHAASIKKLLGGMNARLSQDMDSLMKQMQTQITSLALNERVMPEILHLMGNLSLDQISTWAGTSLIEQGLGNVCKDPITKFT